MDKMNIKTKVAAFIKERFLLVSGVKELSDEDSFFQKGIIDSTGVLELVSFIDVTFGIRMEDEELIPDNLDSISKVVAFVANKNPSPA